MRVVKTHCLYDFTKYYESCVDKKFSGYGPGTPIRVMEITLGPPTEMFPEGEPLLRYKLAAQYSIWYPDDETVTTQGVPLFVKRPPDGLPEIVPLQAWDEFDEIKANILSDSQNLKFFEERHHSQWKQWFSSVRLKLEDLWPSEYPILRFPEPTQVKYQIKVSTRHKEGGPLLPEKQPLQWTGHTVREGKLKKSRHDNSTSNQEKQQLSTGGWV